MDKKCFNCKQPREDKGKIYCEKCLKEGKRPKFVRTATVQIYDKI